MFDIDRLLHQRSYNTCLLSNILEDIDNTEVNSLVLFLPVFWIHGMSDLSWAQRLNVVLEHYRVYTRNGLSFQYWPQANLSYVIISGEIESLFKALEPSPTTEFCLQIQLFATGLKSFMSSILDSFGDSTSLEFITLLSQILEISLLCGSRRLSRQMEHRVSLRSIGRSVHKPNGSLFAQFTRFKLHADYTRDVQTQDGEYAARMQYLINVYKLPQTLQ